GGGVEIERFAVAEGATLQVGTPVALEWEVGGEPAGLTLALPPEESVPLPENQWSAGRAEWTPLTEGDVTLRLVALEAVNGDGTEFSEVARTLRLTIAAAPVTLVPPQIVAFDFSPKSVKAGEPVTFTWNVTGDVAALAIDGTGNRITFQEPALPEGSAPQSFGHRPEAYAVTLVATGKDGTEVSSTPISLQVNPSLDVPNVTLNVT